MKRTILAVVMAVAAFASQARAAGKVTVTDLTLEGEIQGENVVFTLNFKADPEERGAILPVIVGDVAYVDGRLPGGSELYREGNQYLLKLKGGGFLGFGSGGGWVNCKFASKAIKEGDWRRTQFSIPSATIRKISVVCDRDDLEIKFPDGLDVKRQKNKEGKMVVTAFLGTASTFEVVWKPEVKKLDAEAVVSCDANTLATASVGALRTDTVFTYRIIQGSVSKLSLTVPDGLNITQVRGEDIQDWKIDRTEKAQPKLQVTLSRPREEMYRLRVESEMVLSKFPCKFDLPVIAPEQVIRTSGFVMVGTDSAIKVTVTKAGGLTQVDPAAFPKVAGEKGKEERVKPSRSVYTYQYASAPYTLNLTADDVVSTITADDRLVLAFSDNELTLNASIEIDVKDAVAREIIIETDPDPAWNVTSVTGNNVSETDTDVREETVQGPKGKETRRIIYVPFKQAILGPTLVNVRMERQMKGGVAQFTAPAIRVRDAKSERGFVIAAAEKGIRLKTAESAGLREVHASSTQVRVEGAQQAFRFKEPGWMLKVAVDRAVSSLHSELFHLVSLGEGVVYHSVAATYVIDGAPVQEFKLRVPKEIENVHFTGADLEGWTRDGEVFTIRLQRKVMGDYTLLCTYDRQYSQQGADMFLGVVDTVGTESEVGYIAVASSASLSVAEKGKSPASIIVIDRSEIPAAYTGPITDPIIKAFKYVRSPHSLAVRIEPYKTEQLLGQVADYISIDTRITKDGESVTTASYYVKNASRQYLELRLPKGVDLWSIRRVNEDGRREDVLSQQKGEGVYLIPVGRPTDPNTSIHLEVQYARSMPSLGFWRSGVSGTRLAAPTLSETHAAFASWRVEVPEKFSISSARGNLSSEANVPTAGLYGVAKKTWRIFKAVADGWGGYTIRRALQGGWGGASTEQFSTPVNLSGAGPLTLDLQIVPAWVGPAGTARGMIGSSIVAVLLMVLGVNRRKSFLFALGLTALCMALACSAAGRSTLAVAATGVVGLLFIVFMFWRGFRWMWAAVTFVTVTVCWGLVKRLVSALAAIGERRRSAASEPADGDDIPPLEADTDESRKAVPPPLDESGSKGGYVAVRMLAVMLFAASVVTATARSKTSAPPANPVMTVLKMVVDGPGTGKETEQSALVTASLEFKTDDATQFRVLPSDCVLMKTDLSSGNLEISAGPDGYILNVKAGGKYRAELKYRAPVHKKDASWRLDLALLPNVRNSVVLRLPEAGLDIQCESAVFFKTKEEKTTTEAESILGPTPVGVFTWKPRVRRTRLEQTVFYSEVNTFAALQSGVVDLTHLIRYQIAQGEIKDMKVRVPEGMTVTAVSAKGLATWSFDPEKRMLDAILETAVSGDFALTVVTQISREGLPYNATLGVLQVQGAARQRGALAVAAPDTVQVKMGETKGLNPMNIEDFPADAVAASRAEGGRERPGMVIRKAFRYHAVEEVSAKVETERVLPEVRVSESIALSISDERVVLRSQMELLVTKAGIFSIEFSLPEDFDVETLTGRDVSHWDERKDSGRGVVVYFKRQVTEATGLNIVIARTEKGIEKKIVVPRLTVKDAARHTGRLEVRSELGVRLMVDSHGGVDIKKASEEGIKQAGVLVFDILRPNWEITLKTDVMTPVVKPEVLQVVDLAEGMLQCRAHIMYRIENAGVKTFLLKAPATNVTLSVNGAGIARVSEADKEKGVWQVDLQNKVEHGYQMVVSYQIPYDPAKQSARILPLRTVDTDDQRGYVAVTCAGRVQVEPVGDLSGLKAEDARNLPTGTFRLAGDLSGAIRCYRILRPDWDLQLSVVRHDSAKVLPANIENVHMVSTMSANGDLLTMATVSMSVGDMRFLKVQLPGKKDTLWTVLVNGRDVPTSRDGELYCIPLDRQQGEQMTTVQMVYAGGPASSPLSWRTRYEAPKFVGLPLSDIDWDFYALPDRKYYSFGGTMERVDEGKVIPVFAYDEAMYLQDNRKQRQWNLNVARKNLDAAQELLKAGRVSVANKALQQAQNYSQGQADLNEDARVQLRNSQKQQFKLGLVSRRAALRYARNLDAVMPGQAELQAYNPEEYTQDFAKGVERNLSQKDNVSLDSVSDRMLDQQVAAQGVVRAINVTLPRHGKLLKFHRAVQVDPDGELSIAFRTGTGWWMVLFRLAWPAVLLFVVFWILSARFGASKQA